MAINDMLLRAREYIYDKEGLDDFAEELLGADEEVRQAVASYLSGHGLALARLHTHRHTHGPWFWLDKRYLASIQVTLKGEGRKLETIGWGVFETPEQIEGLDLG